METDTGIEKINNEVDLIWSRVCTAFSVTGSKRLRGQIKGPEETQSNLALTAAQSKGLNHSQVALLIGRLETDEGFARKAVGQVETMHKRSGIPQENVPRTWRGRRNIIVAALHRLEERLSVPTVREER